MHWQWQYILCFVWCVYWKYEDIIYTCIYFLSLDFLLSVNFKGAAFDIIFSSNVRGNLVPVSYNAGPPESGTIWDEKLQSFCVPFLTFLITLASKSNNIINLCITVSPCNWSNYNATTGLWASRYNDTSDTWTSGCYSGAARRAAYIADAKYVYIWAYIYVYI